MRAGWTGVVCLAMTAGLWTTAAVTAARAGDQAKGTAAAKSDHAEPKPASPRPKIAVFRLAGDLTELPPEDRKSTRLNSSH